MQTEEYTGPVVSKRYECPSCGEPVATPHLALCDALGARRWAFVAQDECEYVEHVYSLRDALRQSMGNELPAPDEHVWLIEMREMHQIRSALVYGRSKRTAVSRALRVVGFGGEVLMFDSEILRAVRVEDQLDTPLREVCAMNTKQERET